MKYIQRDREKPTNLGTDKQNLNTGAAKEADHFYVEVGSPPQKVFRRRMARKGDGVRD